MTIPKTTYVALLYSIVLTRERRVVMADLKTVALSLGYSNPRTVFATGNLVFEAPGQAIATIETDLETAFAQAFGKPVDIIVRTAESWRILLAGHPFGDHNADQLIVRVMRQPVTDDALNTLKDKASNEQVAAVDGDIWVRFAGKPSASKLLSLLTSKRLGAGTLRNLNTVRKITDILDRESS